MGALRLGAAAVVLVVALGIGACVAAKEPDWHVHVGAAAARFGVPEAWVLRVIAAESGGRTHLGGRPITSSAGAMGLMQVMPATWASLRARYRLGPDPHDPRDNIIAGTAYLRDMYDRFGHPGLFAAYNAGPGRYGDYLARGRPLPRETRDYVAKITGAAPVPRFADARGRGASALPPRVTDMFGPGVRPADAAVIDPIFFKREAADVPALTSAAKGREILPSWRAEAEVDVADIPAASLFLLRKADPNGGR